MSTRQYIGSAITYDRTYTDIITVYPDGHAVLNGRPITRTMAATYLGYWRAIMHHPEGLTAARVHVARIVSR